MATVTLPSSGGAVFRITYTQTSDIATNTSVIQVTKLEVKLSSYTGQFYFSGKVTIDGKTAVSMNATNGTHLANVNSTGTFYKVSGTLGSVTIEHDKDGKKSVDFATVSVKGYYNGSSKFSSATSKNVTLTAIPRGIVHIDSGSGFVDYQVYIDNGSSWDLYMPYADNGSSWDLCC